MSKLNEALSTVYRAGQSDNWGGALIRTQTTQVHETYRTIVMQLTSVLNNPNASEKDKQLVRNKLETLI